MAGEKPAGVVETAGPPASLEGHAAESRRLGPFDHRSDIGQMGKSGAESRSPLPDGGEGHVDIVDHIIRSTSRIWEQHGIGRRYDQYRHDAPQHGAGGTWHDGEQVIANTILMQAAFPDLRLISNDVVWTGNGVEGFTASHRCTLVGRNSGYSRFGVPTGQQLWCGR